jgi:VIT1/CCC1 family predicted Fe2+/Mn2+ transporter
MPDRTAQPDDVARTPERESMRVSEAAVVRRAPRFAAFVRAGVLLGAVIGVLVAALTPASPGAPRSAVIALTALALAALGAIIGAGLAALADRRSQRRVDRAAGNGPSS